MPRRYREVLALVAAAVACRRPPAPRPGPAPAAASLAVRAAEYEVYAAVLTYLRHSVIAEPTTHGAWPCLATPSLLCDARRVPAEFEEAMRDYQARGTVATPLPGLSTLPGVLPASAGADAGCGGPPVLNFSRVGLGADGRRAIVSFVERRAHGPSRGCGYLRLELLLLQREDGGPWRVVRVAGGGVT